MKRMLSELDERTRFLTCLDLSIDTDGDCSNTGTVQAAEVLTSLPITSQTQLGGVMIDNNIDVTP